MCGRSCTQESAGFYRVAEFEWGEADGCYFRSAVARLDRDAHMCSRARAPLHRHRTRPRGSPGSSLAGSAERSDSRMTPAFLNGAPDLAGTAIHGAARSLAARRWLEARHVTNPGW